MSSAAITDTVLAAPRRSLDGDVSAANSAPAPAVDPHGQAAPCPPCGKAAPCAVPGAELEPVLSAETALHVVRAVRLLHANIPVLVRGETGTGKEVFARRVHAESNRRGNSFVAVNCAALPEGLIESELFGYEEGAFTGARRRGHKGLLRQADRGVLFLDEIGDMPLPLQARLLRVLQDRAVSPLGASAAVPVDFALLCATHRPLADMLASGAFRPDLFFRIAPYVVELPPLRDLPHPAAIVQVIWERLGGGAACCQLLPEAAQTLAAYHWPGNFRQLVSLLRTLLVLAEPGQPVGASALPADVAASSATPRAEQKLADVTRSAMQAALELSDGNVSQAARRLGVNRSTLYRQLLWAQRPGAKQEARTPARGL